jgi:hypothetical protein
MTIDEYISSFSADIENAISNNPYAYSPTDETQKNENEFEKEINQLIAPSSLDTLTYEDILYGIVMDEYCEHQLAIYQKESGADYDLPKEELVKSDFETLFKILTDNWCKFLYPSTSKEEVLLLKETPPYIFDIIYQTYPLLCSKLLPVIVFLIGDNYSSFCKIIEKKPSISEHKASILQCFNECFFSASMPYYLCSFLNCKPMNYPNSSQEEGERILSRIWSVYSTYTQKVEDTIDEYDYDYLTARRNLITDIRKIYTHEIKEKAKIRLNAQGKSLPKKADGKEYILLGENFIAFIMLLNKTNELKKPRQDILNYFDLPVTLYCANKITGWVGFSLAYHATWVGAASLNKLYDLFPKLGTLYHLLEWYSSVGDIYIAQSKSDDGKIKFDNRFLSAEFLSVVSDLSNLEKKVSTSFEQWMHTANDNEKNDFIGRLNYTYRRISSQLIQSLPVENKPTFYDNNRMCDALFNCSLLFASDLFLLDEDDFDNSADVENDSD